MNRKTATITYAAALRLLLAVVVLTLSTSLLLAQRGTGTLRGQVLDPQNAVVVGAKVIITNQGTNVSQTLVTSSAGTWSLPDALPGTYTVSVEAKGFKGFLRKNVDVLADQDNVADAKLEVGTASDTVEVTAGTEEIQTTSSALTNSYSSQDVLNVPVVGGAVYSALNLALLAPNTIATPGGVQGTGGAIGGTRPRDNNFTVDGVDDNNLGVTGNNSTVILDSVQEFSLQTNQFSAEYGHSAGGQFTLVTKTGTNKYHGEGHGYFQNRNFNSLDNLTKASIKAGTIPGMPPYDNNRVGGSVGGPFLKNKLFFYGGYEYTDEHGQGTPTTMLGPTQNGLATLNALAQDSAVTNILKNFPVAPFNNAGTVTVSGIKIPIGNLVIISPILQHEHDAVFNTDFSTGPHQLSFRFLFNQAQFIAPVNSTQAAFNQNEPVRNRKISVDDVWTVHSNMVNDLRLQYAYYRLTLLNPCSPSTCPQDVTINELGGVTIGPGDFQTQKQNTYEIVDTLSWVRGKHSFKFGGQYMHFIYPQFFLPRSNGDNQYLTTQTFINDAVGDNPGRTLRNAGTGEFLGTQSAIYGFIQDDFKVTPRLTLNLGLRYEYWTNPVGDKTQALNAIASVPGVITFVVPTTDMNNFAPRVGFAFDPTGSGKTSIRGGFGIAYDVKFQNFVSITLPPQLQTEFSPNSACGLPVSARPAWCATFLVNPANVHNYLATGGLPTSYPPPDTSLAARNITTSFIDDTVMPKVLTWSLGVQRELYRNAVLEARYLGTRGLELPVQYRRNHISYFDGGGRPLPMFLDPASVPQTWDANTFTDAAFNSFNSNIYAQFGFRGNVTSDPPKGASIYNAFSVNYTQRATKGLTLNANYTYSHTIDNSTNEFFTSFLNPRRAQDTNQLQADRSNSDLNVFSKFALALTYQVPNVNSGNKFVKGLTNGFNLGTSILAQTGQPITIQSAGIDANGNGDTAGDRVVFNSRGIANTGSDSFAICELPGGTTGLSNGGPGSFNVPTGVAAGGACFDPSDPTGGTTFPAIGYTPVNPRAKYIIPGNGVKTTTGRNNFSTPGFWLWNLSVTKNINFTESKYLQVGAQVFNILNHPNYTLSNGNVFSTAGITTATSNPGYAFPTDPNFLNAKVFSGGIRSMILGAKFIF